ncbi:hypothetical protein [Luteimonas salinilitoris]|uniref:DUF2569 domain-containing protein n=1 Tax=Luteimonas salinilitoris TaxID=3237697 RepID=A0ABV4HKX5_9GAMM
MTTTGIDTWRPPRRAARTRLAVRSPLPWLLLAGLVAGGLELSVAFGFWALRDVGPLRILQAIASWALGREAAFAGGAQTAALGAALYVYLVTAMAAAYYCLGRRYPGLHAHPLRYGALYGLALYVLMFRILVPLSAAPPPRQADPAWTLTCIVAYALCVGIPCALFAKRATDVR